MASRVNPFGKVRPEVWWQPSEDDCQTRGVALNAIEPEVARTWTDLAKRRYVRTSARGRDLRENGSETLRIAVDGFQHRRLEEASISK